MANVIYNIEEVKVFDYMQGGTVTDWTPEAEDTESKGFDKRLAAATSLGMTQGGGTLNQEVTEIEVRSDQCADPLTILTKEAKKTLTLNLLEATPETLKYAFAGEANGDMMSFKRLPEGMVKSVYIRTKSVDGTYFEFRILKAKMKGNSSINFGADEVTKFPVEMTILSPDDENSEPIRFYKKTA